MLIKGQPRGSYSRISKMDKQKAVEMKAQGIKNKQINKETGIKMKTLYSLQIEKKFKFGPIMDRIKILYLEKEHFRENMLPEKKIRKEIKIIVDSGNDQQLNSLIELQKQSSNSSKKFDSSNRRVIERIAKEIYENKLMPQQKGVTPQKEVYYEDQTSQNDFETPEYVDWNQLINYESNQMDIYMEEVSSVCYPKLNYRGSDIQDFFPCTETQRNTLDEFD